MLRLSGWPYPAGPKPLLVASRRRSVLEERARVLGRQLSRLPVSMAETGEIPISERQIMQAGGRARAKDRGTPVWHGCL